jgi:murein L,D-transpeptidase YafK
MKPPALAILALPVSCSARGDSVDTVCNSFGPRRATVVCSKRDQTLCVFGDGQAVFSTPASHGRKQGPKAFEGDQKTPDGHYTLSPARRSSRFGYFFAISYPNTSQVAAAKAAGRRAGGDIGVHGPQQWYAFLGDWQR